MMFEIYKCSPELGKKFVVRYVLQKHYKSDRYYNWPDPSASFLTIEEAKAKLEEAQRREPRNSWRIIRREVVVETVVLEGIVSDKAEEDNLPHQLISLLLRERDEAKQSKDFARADKIRDALSNLGITLLDHGSGKVQYFIK